MIFVCNHRSFIDPFIVGLCSRRPIYYVAKEEIFHIPFGGWLISALGAFPVRRGAADADMIETAKAILERGDAVLMFPEGTPHPAWRARQAQARRRPARTRDRRDRRPGGDDRHRGDPQGLAHPPAQDSCPDRRAAELPEGRERDGPARGRGHRPHLAQVMLQWEWLGGLPPLRRAAVIGSGSWSTSLSVRLARAGIDVDLGTSAPAEDGLPPRVRAVDVSELEFYRYDLVVFSLRASELPAAVAEYGPQFQHRTGVLVRSTGLVPPLGTLPSGYVAERVDSWAVGALGGPTDILEAEASVVVASSDAAFARQVQVALRAAKLKATRTADVTGTELASCADTAAALAAAAAAEAGPDAQGAAARQVLAELDAFARRTGTSPAGFGSTDDLVGTAVAKGGRFRRAGELQPAGHRRDPAARGAPQPGRRRRAGPRRPGRDHRGPRRARRLDLHAGRRAACIEARRLAFTGPLRRRPHVPRRGDRIVASSVLSEGCPCGVRAGQPLRPDLKRLEDRAVDQVIAMQEGAGVDVVSDGEMRRFLFMGPITETVEGIEPVEHDSAMPWSSPEGDVEWILPAAVTSKLRKRRSMVTEEYATRGRARGCP